MKHLVIIGARGFGREIYGLAHDTMAFKNGEMDIKGFLDDKADALDGVAQPPEGFPPILATVETYQLQPDDVFFCALGDPKWRRHYAEIILAKGGEFVSLISPKAGISPAAKIGIGCMVGSGVCVSTNVVIGDFTVIHAYSVIGHDTRIGSYNSLEAFCFLGGHVKTGDESFLHVRSSIIRQRRVGSRVTVGIGSVVMRNYGDDVHLFGNPAKKMVF